MILSEFCSYSSALILSTIDSFHCKLFWLLSGALLLFLVFTCSAADLFLEALLGLDTDISLSTLYKSIALAAERASVSFS